MDQPRIADKRPTVLELEAGKKYWWCACGLSTKQPFCDGSHKGTKFAPVPFESAEARRAALCNCKQAAAPVFCDGAHKKL